MAAKVIKSIYFHDVNECPRLLIDVVLFIDSILVNSNDVRTYN